MSIASLGRTLVIANPAAHSGMGAAGIEQVERFFAVWPAATSGVTVRRTARSGDAQKMAAEAVGVDTVLVLGGDGVIHETVNGLVAIDPDLRPRLGVLPLGTGNDFARTLGLRCNDVSTALEQLLTGETRTIDLGFATSDACPQGVFFAETLSFGIDAAIAIDTTVRRAQGTKQHGTGLFLTSSLKLFSRAQRGDACTVCFDGEPPQRLTTLILAIQNGPTYGGGFRICPQASPADGLLDICYNVRHPWVPHLLVLLGLARFGRHTRSRAVCMRQASRVKLSFERDDVPCQVDGEQLTGTHFEVSVCPQALRVIAPRPRAYSSNA